MGLADAVGICTGRRGVSHLGLGVGGEPGETFVEPVSLHGAGRLHKPVSIADSRQTQLLLDLGGFHRCGKAGLGDKIQYHNYKTNDY